jgi:hypothetical protein
VPIDRKNKSLAILVDRATSVDELLQQYHSFGIKWQGSEPMMLCLFSHSFSHLFSALWTEAVVSTQSGFALRTEHSQSTLEMKYGHGALGQIYVFYGNGQSLRYTAAQAEQESDKQLIPQAGSCLLHSSNVLWFQIGPHFIFFAFYSLRLIHLGFRCVIARYKIVSELKQFF